MMSHTVQTAAQVIVDLATDLPTPRDCSCRHALDNAVLTDAAAVSAVMRDRVDGFRDRSAGPSRAPLTQKGST
jgi:hypothetical protein